MNIVRAVTDNRSFSFGNIFKFLAIAAVVLLVGYVIAQAEWKYLGVLLIPVLIYVSIRRPFIFPLGAYAFSIPFDSISSVTGSGKIMTLTKVLGILTILILCLKGVFEKKIKKPDHTVLLWTLFVAYGILSVIWADKIEIAMRHVPTAAGLLLLYLVAASYETDRKNFEILKWGILLGGLSASLLAMRGFLNGVMEFNRATLQFGGMTMNPNGLAFDMILPLAICIEMYLKQRNKRMKGLFLAFCFSIAFCFIISGSRGNMLAAGIVLLVYIYSAQRKIGLSIALLMVGLILIQFLPPMFYSRWDTAVSGGGSGRLDIWYVGWKALGKYWLFGAGLLNFPVAYTEFASYAHHFQGINRDPHNIYLAAAVELGVVGFTLLVLAMWKHYRLLRKKFPSGESGQVMLKASFWAISVSSFFDTRLWNKGFWLLWIMILMHSNIAKSEQNRSLGTNHQL